MFDEIVNPVTNEIVKLNSKSGQEILENYKKTLLQQGGTWDLSSNQWKKGCKIIIDTTNSKGKIIKYNPKYEHILKAVHDWIVAALCYPHFDPSNLADPIPISIVNAGGSGSGNIIRQQCRIGNDKGLFLKIFVPHYDY